MEEETNEEKFFVVEWTIENFSCWNSEVHDEAIPSPQFKYNFLKLKLYPRGTGGCGEHLLMELNNERRMVIFGDLSFIGSDGSLILTQGIKTKGEQTVKFPPGPKFDKVVAQIRKSEDVHKDKLTIRYRRRTMVSASVEFMRTTIDAYDVSVKICRERFQDLGKCKRVSLFKFPFDDGSWEGMDLFIESIGFSTVTIKLITSGGKFLALINTSVLSKDDAVLKSERREHLFKTGETINLNSLKREEVRETSFSFLLSVKVVPSNKYKHRCCYYFDPEKDVLTTPSLILEHQSTPISMKVPFDNSTVLSTSSDHPDDSTTVLTKELMCLYQDQDFSDFQLKCRGVSIPVHKSILSARSPVFKTMLSTDMIEAASGCMDIVDLDPSTLGLFLTYLYTGTVEDLQGESALKLYYTADKYQVHTLKRKCVSVLITSVSISNVCDIFSLAEKHQDSQLKSAANEFFSENFNEVLESEEWNCFINCEPFLAVKTVTRFAQKKICLRK